MIAVTPATDISKASLASFVTSKPLDLHGQSDEKIDGCRDLVGAGGLGGWGCRGHGAKFYTSLGVVPDAQYRKSGNIKKLPLISYKAAANRTDADLIWINTPTFAVYLQSGR